MTQPKADTTVALLQHLSKEIELANAVLTAQRTKNNLLVAFGPFVVLGGLAANESATQRVQDLPDLPFAVAAVFVFASYCALGYLAASVEERLWRKCNEWRTEIARICEVEPAVYRFETVGLYAVYLSIFGVLALAFTLLLWMLHSV